jgi:antitoxin component YwqK of YwqJK toxin-antitoxin module
LAFWSNAAPGKPDWPPFHDCDTLPRNGVYSGKIWTDSVFYDHQLSFANRDTVLLFLDEKALRLNEIPCATFYRVVPVNKYYQQNGLATDYYLSNDSIAARLPYNNGVLDGPCLFYYRNGQIREKGTYAKNARIGTWDYYYDNGAKAKTVRFTDTGVYLLDCFKETGEMLAQSGNGRFEGVIQIGMPSNPTELRMSGPVKDGAPDGEWKLYSRFLSHPLFVERFSSGKFLHGTSNSISGKTEYDKKFFSTVESIHPVESLDYYAHSDFCTVAGKLESWDPGEPMEKEFTEIGSGFKEVLKSNKYHDYSGWVLLDIQYDKAGQVSAKTVRLYQENEAFRKELMTMLDRLPKPGKLTLDGKSTPYERFFVVLVEANEMLIPEEVLYKRRQVIHFNSN